MTKIEVLKEYLKDMESVAIAFSGGVDSTFLLKVAHDVLGEDCVAITARSCSFPERELNEAREFCSSEGIKHIIVDSEELNIDGFAQNPPNRCYLCKTELFAKMKKAAGKLKTVLATYNDAEDLINIGAYRSGANKNIDYAISKIDQVNAFLTQETDEKFSFEDIREQLLSIFRD